MGSRYEDVNLMLQNMLAGEEPDRLLPVLADVVLENLEHYNELQSLRVLVGLQGNALTAAEISIDHLERKLKAAQKDIKDLEKRVAKLEKASG